MRSRAILIHISEGGGARRDRVVIWIALIGQHESGSLDSGGILWSTSGSFTPQMIDTFMFVRVIIVASRIAKIDYAIESATHLAW
jgi:hypothetical protein